MDTNHESDKGERDIYRDTWVRYFGYCNEVGEAFRPIFPRLVLPSYGASFLYVLCDAADKGLKANEQSSQNQRSKAVAATFDTLLWQTLASVLVPGFTINQIVKKYVL